MIFKAFRNLPTTPSEKGYPVVETEDEDLDQTDI